MVGIMYGDSYEVLDEGDVTVEGRNFDVVAVDYQMLDTTAFSMLSVFAEKFSGCQIDFDLDNLYNSFGHVTGYNDEAYNKLIDEAYEAYKAGDTATLSAKLHEAEKKLLNDMPVIPIFEYTNIVLKSDKLSGIKYSAWGSFDFKTLKLKNWQDYVPTEEKK